MTKQCRLHPLRVTGLQRRQGEQGVRRDELCLNLGDRSALVHDYIKKSRSERKVDEGKLVSKRTSISIGAYFDYSVSSARRNVRDKMFVRRVGLNEINAVWIICDTFMPSFIRDTLLFDTQGHFVHSIYFARLSRDPSPLFHPRPQTSFFAPILSSSATTISHRPQT